MDTSNPFSLRSGSVDPLALMPSGPRKPAQGKSPANFERHLDSPRADQARRAERDRGRDEDERVAARDDNKRADATKDKKDAAKQSDTQEDDKGGIELAPDAGLLAVLDAGSKDEAAPEMAVEETVLPVATGEAPNELASAEGGEEGDISLSAAAKPDAPAAASDASGATKPGTISDSPDLDAGTIQAKPPAHEAQSKAKTADPLQTAPSQEALTNADATPRPENQLNKPGQPRDQADITAPVNTLPADKAAETKQSLGLGHEAAAKMAQNKADAKSDPKSAADKPTEIRASSGAPAASAPAASASQIAPASSSVASDGSTEGQSPASQQALAPVSSHSNNSNTPTIRFGTLPGHNMPTQVPAGAIALQMARNLQKGISRFDIRLDPAELGRIDVRMEVQKDGRVAAHLIVERPETLDLLQRDASSLQRALNDAGLQTGSDSLNFSLRDQNAGNGSPFTPEGRPDHFAASTAEADEDILSPIYNVNLSANGGVDIRV